MPMDLVPIVTEYVTTYMVGEDHDLPTVEQDHPALAQAHAPTRRRWINVAEGDLVRAAADEVERLARSVDGLSPSDIVLLADHAHGRAIVDESRRRGIDCLSIFTEHDGLTRRARKRGFWAGTPGVKGCTIHSFKGWEARAVVCVPSSRGRIELYIAMTRVKAAPSRPAFLSIVNAVVDLSPFQPRFEREVLPSEVPALAGQSGLDL
jgi:hypothetical protein